MTTGHVFIAASLDGYIARKDGGIDWLLKQKTEGEDHGYDAFIASVDGIVMGRKSFESVLTFESWLYEKPVVVVSRSGCAVPADLAGKVEVSALSPRDLMSMLGERGWTRVYVDGGMLIQSFLREGLIADIQITHIPILIGEGRPLFGSLPADIDLEHTGTESFASGLVTSRYRVLAAPR